MSQPFKQSYYGSSRQDLRIILLGNIGCGKTSSADTILGQLLPLSPNASRQCQLRQGISDGRNVTLVEAPRWYWDGGKMESSVEKETKRAMTMVAPGLHAILLLVPIGLFTEMEARVPAELEKLFGKDALDHTLVLLTCGDYLMGKRVEDYLQEEHPGLRQVMERCGGRHHVINNRQRQDREQVQELLEKVDNMVKKNGVYSMKAVQETEIEEGSYGRNRGLQESYSAQNMERNETTASAHYPSSETLRGIGREEYSSTVERRREERVVDGNVGVSQVSNGLNSASAPDQHSYSEPFDSRVRRTPSFRLNADGAILSQMSGVDSPPKVVNTSTLHHRINSFEDRSPPRSPTSTSHSPLFSSLPSSPAFVSYPSSPSSPSFPSSLSSLSSPSPSSPELRLVMLGRSGAGKSRAGNVILGREAFASYPDSFTAITQECEKTKSLVEDRWLAVVDTPDWFNSERTPDEVRAQISSCVTLSSPGPHAFLLCVPLDQPAKTELRALGVLESVFGPEAVQRYTLVLFTYADRLRESGMTGGDSVEAYITGQRQDLLKLVEKCGDRFHVMETGGKFGGRRNVAELLRKVEQTVKEAGGECYSCPAFQEAEKRVRERQVEIARGRKEKRSEEERQERRFSPERWVLYPHMQTVTEEEEEVGEDELEETRDEAVMSVKNMTIESLPPVTTSIVAPSVLRSIMDTMQSSTTTLTKLLADGSVLVSRGAEKVGSSPVWGTVGSRAQNVQKAVAASPVWGKVGAGAGHVSKLIGDRVPQRVVDGSTWVGSGAKAAAASPVWGKVGSGAKLVADGSMRAGAGFGTRAKDLAQSPMWGKVGSGAVNGAKLVAQNSVRVGAGIGAGAKKVALSPVWGKMGSGAKAGAKTVAESPVWEKIGSTAKKVPLVVIAGALLGLLLGVFLGGVIGGAVGAAAGSAVSEVGRRTLGNKNTFEQTSEDGRKVETALKDGVDSLAKQGEKVLKTE